MKKVLLSLCLILNLLLVSTSGVFVQASTSTQAGTISKVLVDKKLVKLDQNPTIINGEVYFTLNNALYVTGITNNSKNIKVGKSNSSITITKGNLKVNAKVNSKTVTINNKNVTLKAPVILKGKTIFIPAGLIYKYSGKLVIYSSSLKIISVINEKDYKKLDAYFSGINKTLTNLKDCSFKTDMSINMDMGDYGKVQYDAKSSGSCDKTNKITKSSVTNTFITEAAQLYTNTENYLIDSKCYSKDLDAGGWQKTDEADNSLNMFSSFTNNAENSNDSLSSNIDPNYDAVINSSCTLTANKDGTVTTISSCLFTDTIVDEIAKETFTGGKLSNASMTISIDNTTKMYKNINMTMSGTAINNGIKVNLKANIIITFSDYNKGNTLSIPDDLNEYIQSQQTN